MVSLTLRAIFGLLAVFLVVLATLYQMDEKALTVAHTFARLRNGKTVTVRIVYQSHIARFLRHFTSGRLFAVTIWNRVYVSSDFLVPTGLQHELEHVRQWHEHGPVKFACLYLWQLWRVGYAKAPLELAAQHASGEKLPHLR